MNIYLDIETIPQQSETGAKALIRETIEAPAQMSKADTIKAWHEGTGKYAGVKEVEVEKAYRKTSFDGAKGQICSICAVTDDTEMVFTDKDIGEAMLISNFFEVLKDKLNGRQPYFIGHYIGKFDLKFLFQRAVINKIKPGMDLGQWGRHNSNFYDTMLAWSGYGGSISLDNLCKALGIEGKPDDIDGSKVWDFYKAGDIERIAEYNLLDVKMVKEVYERLTFQLGKV